MARHDLHLLLLLSLVVAATGAIPLHAGAAVSSTPPAGATTVPVSGDFAPAPHVEPSVSFGDAITVATGSSIPAAAVPPAHAQATGDDKKAGPNDDDGKNCDDPTHPVLLVVLGAAVFGVGVVLGAAVSAITGPKPRQAEGHGQQLLPVRVTVKRTTLPLRQHGQPPASSSGRTAAVSVPRAVTPAN